MQVFGTSAEIELNTVIADMYILGIGPEFLPTAVRVDYIAAGFVGSSFLLPQNEYGILLQF